MQDQVNATADDISNPSLMDNNSHPDADNHALLKDDANTANDPSTEQFMNERNTMLANKKVDDASENNKGMVTL